MVTKWRISLLEELQLMKQEFIFKLKVVLRNKILMLSQKIIILKI